MSDYMDCPICGEGHNKIDMQYWIKNMVTNDMIERACRAYNDVAYGIREDNASRSAMRAALEAALGGGG